LLGRRVEPQRAEDLAQTAITVLLERYRDRPQDQLVKLAVATAKLLLAAELRTTARRAELLKRHLSELGGTGATARARGNSAVAGAGLGHDGERTAGDEAGASPGESAVAGNAERLAALTAALRELGAKSPRDHRLISDLARGVPRHVTAEALGMSEPACRTALARALDRLAGLYMSRKVSS
jgi:DNA-directed RNA polymerase specialized sigma24 family protein